MKNKSKVYLETSFISYLTNRPSKDSLVEAHQKITKNWWKEEKAKFNLFISEFVIEEISQGEQQQAKKRLKIIESIDILKENDEVFDLARTLIHKGPLPEKAGFDALHIAIAILNGIDYVLTWNCKHIANIFVLKRVIQISESLGYNCPMLCTPETLLEVNHA